MLLDHQESLVEEFSSLPQTATIGIGFEFERFRLQPGEFTSVASSGHSHRCYYFAGHAAPPRCHPEFTRVFSLPPPPPESPVNLPGLDLYGVRQYLSQHATLHLYGWTAQRLPDWFTTRFRAEYHRKCLFREQPGALLHVSPLENRSGAPEASAPERAFLEMISEIGVRQPLQEARGNSKRNLQLARRGTLTIIAKLHQRQNRATVPATGQGTIPDLDGKTGYLQITHRKQPAPGCLGLWTACWCSSHPLNGMDRHHAWHG